MTGPDKKRHTIERLRHPALDPMASYVSAFGIDSLRRMEKDIQHLYQVGDLPRIGDRLEFSLVFAGPVEPALRYTFFQLHDRERIKEHFKRHGYPHAVAGRVMEIMGTLPKEFGVGLDLSLGKERMKLYCLRLDSDKGRMSEVTAAVEKLASELGTPVRLPEGIGLGKITLVAVDLFADRGRRDLKVYTIHPAQASLPLQVMENLKVKGPCAARMMQMIKEDRKKHFIAALQCFRFSNQGVGLTGYSCYSHIQRDFWPEVEAAAGEMFPNHHSRFRSLQERVASRGWNIAVEFIGTSFSLPCDGEKFHAYFTIK